MNWIDILIGFATGIISGFGVGGGSLLILYLTAFNNVNPFTAGGVNLLYFTGCAPAALVSHIRNKRIEFRAVCGCLVLGVPLSFAAALLSSRLDAEFLRKAFSVLLLYVGIREMLYRKRKATQHQ